MFSVTPVAGLVFPEVIPKGQWRSRLGVGIGIGIERVRDEIWTREIGMCNRIVAVLRWLGGKRIRNRSRSPDVLDFPSTPIPIPILDTDFDNGLTDRPPYSYSHSYPTRTRRIIVYVNVPLRCVRVRVNFVALARRCPKRSPLPTCPLHSHPESIAQRRGGVFELAWGEEQCSTPCLLGRFIRFTVSNQPSLFQESSQPRKQTSPFPLCASARGLPIRTRKASRRGRGDVLDQPIGGE